MSFSDTQLEELSVSLREKNQRLEFPKSTIQQLWSHLKSITPCISNSAYNTSILTFKIFANYVAEVEENSEYVFNMIKNDIIITPTNLNHSIDDIEVANLYLKVQLILLDNILTTCAKCVSRNACSGIMDKIFSMYTWCETTGVAVDSYLIIEILDQFQSIIDKIPVSLFVILREMCLSIKEEALSEDDQDLLSSVSKTLLQYSSNLDTSLVEENEEEEIFFNLYNSLSDKLDQQILLNVSFDFGLSSLKFMDNYLEVLFDSQGDLQVYKNIPMSLLILSNTIVSEEHMQKFISKVSVKKLANTYFSEIYPDLSLQSPWDLQSIVLFNKIPNSEIFIDGDAIFSYINKLSTLINITTLQIRKDLVGLQMIFLGKVFASLSRLEVRAEMGPVICDELTLKIENFITDLKLSTEYSKFSTEFKQNVSRIYFPFLNINKHRPDDNVEAVLKSTLLESTEHLQKSIEDESTVEFTYLMELSKILGFYVKVYGHNEWFKNCFGILQNVVEISSSDMNSKMEKHEQIGWQALESNIRYVNALLNIT